jgi:guanylate cyclase
VTAIIQRVVSIGADPSDDPVLALQKQILVAFGAIVGLAAALWGLTYFAYDELLAGSIPFGYAVVSAISLGIFGATRHFAWLRRTQLALMLVLPFLLQLSLGGFEPSSAVIVWAVMTPIGGMLVSTRRVGFWLFLGFLALLATAQLVQPALDPTNGLPPWLRQSFFAFNLGGVATTAFLTVFYFVGEKDRALDLLATERQRSERLLLNVLPREVAEQLKDGSETIARHYDSVSILFADIVGFTPLTHRLGADELVTALNEVFRQFDDLVAAHGCEKIRTIGDNYMVAAGVPTPTPDHADRIAALALDMLDVRGSTPIEFRIGINSGPAVAGVIGKSKFQYDLWGESVNLASRMESQGAPGRIQVTAETRRLLGEGFACTRRGTVDIKGGGATETWFLDERTGKV